MIFRSASRRIRPWAGRLVEVIDLGLAFRTDHRHSDYAIVHAPAAPCTLAVELMNTFQ